MLGSMGEQKASLQSPPIQSRSPGPPHAGARHPISHNHSTELKDTAHPPNPHPLPASLNTQMETGTHTHTRKQKPNQTHIRTQTIKHTKSLLIMAPLLYPRPHTVLEAGEGGQHSRRVPDDPLIPPWTIGSHSVVSARRLLMCHSYRNKNVSILHECINLTVKNIKSK